MGARHFPWVVSREAAHFRRALFSLFLGVVSLAIPWQSSAAQEKGREQEKSKEKEKPAAGKTEHETKPSPGAQPEEDKSGVVLAGQVSEDSAGPQGLIRFWLTIENRTTATLDSLQLRNPEVRGFSLKRLCWPAAADDHCQEIQTPGDGASAAPQLPSHFDLTDHLSPQQSVTVWGYFEATDSEPKQNAFATVSWSVAGAPSSKTVTLGEIESLSSWRAIALQIIHGWEWSFPLATLLGGFFYTQWTKYKEGKAKSKEERRDHQRRTWNLMLPRSQQAALKFYTPLAASARSARDQLRKFYATRDPDDLPGACFEMLFFHYRLRAAIDHIGGYYFKSLEAEQLADLVYRKHRFLLGLNDSNNRSVLSAAVDRFKPTTNIAHFRTEKDDQASPMHHFWTYFDKWAKTHPGREHLATDILVLDAYVGLLEYEANRPSLHWYGKQDAIRFTLAASREMISEWAAWKDRERLNLSDQLVTDYEKLGRNYLTEVEKPVDATVED